MELDVFRAFAAHPKVQQDLGDVTRRIAQGEYSRSSAILSALFVVLAQQQ